MLCAHHAHCLQHGDMGARSPEKSLDAVLGGSSLTQGGVPEGREGQEGNSEADRKQGQARAHCRGRPVTSQS